MAAIASFRCSSNAACSAGVKPFGTGILGGSWTESAPESAEDEEVLVDEVKPMFVPLPVLLLDVEPVTFADIGMAEGRFNGVSGVRVVCGGGCGALDPDAGIVCEPRPATTDAAVAANGPVADDPDEASIPDCETELTLLFDWFEFKLAAVFRCIEMFDWFGIDGATAVL